MPRDIVLGNGQLLINLDKDLAVRDIYYPYVGWANHVGGHRCRTGVWVEGVGFRWFDDGWQWLSEYVPGTNVTRCVGNNEQLNMSVTVNHCVLSDKNVYVQHLRITNRSGEKRGIRVFTSYDLRMDESDIGDTAMFQPFCKAMVHYKRDRYVLYTGRISTDGVTSGISEYACGDKGFRGAEGTWRDAEDGRLSMNSIAQGAVDGVCSYSATINCDTEAVLELWTCIGDSMAEVVSLHESVESNTVSALLECEIERCQVTQSKPRNFYGLSKSVESLYERSRMVIRTQSDRNGAIIASNDSDIMETARAHYSYMWPRDGALVSFAMDNSGDKEISRAFFEFCCRVLPNNRGMLLHKYGPDGTMGASWHPWVTPSGEPEEPFQEDGTALVIWSAWKHFFHHSDVAFAESFYQRFVHAAADFILEYRDLASGLPLSSWDLWEERYGTHIFTAATVWAALDSAARFAHLLGHLDDAVRYHNGADSVRDGIENTMWSEEHRRFARMVTFDAHGNAVKDMTIDSSAYALFAFGVFAPEHLKTAQTMDAVEKSLSVDTDIGGIARYERDYYFRMTEDFAQVPGNPWIICTLWLAEWQIALSNTIEALSKPRSIIEWVAQRASQTGMLPEQVHPYSGEAVSVAPLTWSHAQFMIAVDAYVCRAAALGAG